MSSSTVVAAERIVLSRWPNLNALGALFVMTLRHYARGRRLLALALLFSLPAVLAAVVELASGVPPQPEALQFALLSNLIPHALAPLAALLYAAGIIQDEVEGQTLTYLLLRPLPRWAMYLTRLLAALVVTSVLTVVFTLATTAVITLTAKEPATAALFGPALKTCCLLALAEVGYCGLFGFLGLLMRRSLVVGVGYIVLFEGLLASLDTVARRMTVMYYFRILTLRWLGSSQGKQDWSIDLTTAPQSPTCVWIVLSAGLILALAGAIVFAVREYRMKTPEGT